MKKIMFLAVSMLCFSMFASDTLNTTLYWMIDKDYKHDRNYSSAAYAMLVVKNGANSIECGAWAMSDALIDKQYASGRSNMGYWLFEELGSTDLSGATFFVELLDSSEAVIAESTRYGYAALLAAGALDVYASGGTTPATATGAFVFDTFVVPEPTSGLMILMGLAGLALRRRKRV